jgi:hypothetical protein
MIRLLRDCIAVDDARDPKTRAAVLYDDFINNGYLHGASARNKDGIPDRYIITNMTVSGRMFLQELETEEKDSSFLGKAKKVGLFVGGWLLGLLTQAAIIFIKQKFAP